MKIPGTIIHSSLDEETEKALGEALAKAGLVSALIRQLVARARRIVERLLAIEIVDKSLVVGAQAFSALIPLLIVLASLSSHDGSSFADAMIERFALSGDSADAVHAAFAAPASGSTVTILGILLVVFSALSFSRTLQRVFELTWGLPRRGMRGTLAGLRWLGLVVIYFALHPLLGGSLHGVVGSRSRWPAHSCSGC